MNSLDPVMLFAHSRRAAWFWFWVALGGWTLAMVSPYLTIQAAKQKEKAIILDGTGNILYAPVFDFRDATALHAYHVRQICRALLERNPNGSDEPEILDQGFIEPARSQAKQLIQNSLTEFQEKQIHQKCEVLEMKILDAQQVGGHEAYRIEVKGQLIRAGVLNGLAFTDPPLAFQLRLVLLRNADLVTNNKLPLVVYQFELTTPSQ